MKKQTIFKAMMAGSLGFLCACGGGSTAEEQFDAKELYGCNVINVYNAGEYIGDGVLTDFEKIYNARINYDTFDSNESMYTKLLGGSAYDVLVPSDYSIERLIQEGMLQKLDKDALENLELLDTIAVDMQKEYDPELAYAVPYFRGSVGLVYNKTNVDPAVIEEKGWDILLDETYRGRVFMYDSQRDAFMVAFKALGYSMNTENPEEIEAAYNWLIEMDKAVEPSYVMDEVIDAMMNGEKDIALMYSGDAAYVCSENEEMAYLEPYQGTNIWEDAMVIPASSQCPGLAHAFVDYITGYDAAYANSETVGYTAVNKQVFDEMSTDEELYGGVDGYIPRTGYDKDEVFHFNEVLRQELSDRWNKVKAGSN